MRTEVIGRGVEVDGATRERIDRRLGFALGRFGDRVGRVAVYLVDLNGPRGGVDKQCRVVAEVLGHGLVVVEDTNASLTAAIDRAADRVGQGVRRRLDGARLYAGLVDTPPAGRN